MQSADSKVGRYAKGEKTELKINGSKCIVNTFFNMESNKKANEILCELIENELENLLDNE